MGFRSATSVLVAASAFLAVFPLPGAQAATVTAVSQDPGASFGLEELRFQAAPGEENDVTISVKGAIFASGWLVNDNSAPLTAGPGCESLDAHTASCPLVGTEVTLGVNVALGDGHDWANVGQACGHNDQDFPCDGATVDGGSGADLIWGGEDHPSILRGGEDGDRLVAGRFGATLDGGPGADSLIGSAANDTLIAGSGNDVNVFGYAGNDRAWGGDGDDIIDGGKGNDTISGGRGRDGLLGASGRDTFYAKDGYRDSIDGGGQIDSAGIDRGKDTTRHVERIHG
jgi:Ca2+-binding RTX toxin-like protein